MVDIAQLGIQIDSKTAVKAVDDLDDLTLAAGRAEGATQDLSAASKRMTPALGGVATGASKVSQNSRMMAMQLSQVAQQTSATGNFVQALAIQLPDMAMGFNAAYMAAAVLASVALPLLASAFVSTEDEGKALAEAMDAASEALDAFNASSSAAQTTAAELAVSYGALADEVQRALAAIASADQAAALAANITAVQTLTASLLETVTAREAAADGSSIRRLTEDFGLLKSETKAIGDAFVALENADTFAKQAEAAARLMNALDGARDSAGRLPPPLQAAYDQIARMVPKTAEAANQISKLPGLLNAAAGAANSASSAVAGIGNAASGAYGAVSALVAKMWEMGQARAAYSKSVGGGRGPGMGGPALDPYGFRDQLARDAAWKPPSMGGGGGGGGGGTDSFADDLKALVEEQRSEMEVLIAWHEEKLALLNDTRAKELLGEQEHKAAMVQLEMDYRDKLAAIRAEEMSARLTDTANLFGGLASVAEAGGKKMLKVSAGLSAAQTIIAGYEAAMTAAAKAPTLAGKIAAYAYWIGTSVKAVAGIKKAGGIGGGGGMGAAAQGATTPTAPQTRLIVQGISLTDIITGEMLMNILGKEFGARNVEFVR